MKRNSGIGSAAGKHGGNEDFPYAIGAWKERDDLYRDWEYMQEGIAIVGLNGSGTFPVQKNVEIIIRRIL